MYVVEFMDTKDLVQTRLREVFGDDSIVFDRSRFVGGLTNYNYRMTIGGADYVVREPGLMTEEIIDRHIERVNMGIASELGITSACIYFDEKSGMKISRYIDSLNFALCDPCAPKNLEAVARLTKMLHTSGKRFSNVFDWRSELEKYERVTASLKGVLPFEYPDLRDRLYAFFDRNIKSQVLLPCHNDTVPENFLVDKSGRCYLIDWEYSGMNDPAWDVAAYIVESRLSGEAVRTLIDSYYSDGVTSEELIRIKCYVMAQDLLWSTWALIRHYGGEDFLDYYSIRYTRFKRNLNALERSRSYKLADMVKPVK